MFPGVGLVATASFQGVEDTVTRFRWGYHIVD